LEFDGREASGFFVGRAQNGRYQFDRGRLAFGAGNGNYSYISRRVTVD
jgi:hypothetical protein